MGNSNQKKKKLQAEKILLASPKSSKDNQKELWLFVRPDKVNTGTGHSHFLSAGPKRTEEQKRLSVHYSASQHHQENVFIEGSRPQYLEDLHTEAQEGLKILQEEHRSEVSFPDDESIASTNTLQQEQDVSSKDQDGCPESRSSTGNSDISVLSAGSTKHGLTRQGTTFKPLNPVKSIDRNKKRSRRTTIMGIPSQVQKELALRRHSTFQQLPENNDTSDSQSGVVIIPTVDGGTPVANKEGARVHLSELEQVSREDKLLQKHLQAMYQDEQHFSFQGFGHHMGPTSTLRPKSVAVPGMTSSLSSPATMFSFLQEPQGPVMSMSPQATYMSTIIPNAVLLASVDVIEIDHGLSRTRGSSVRTVSKSSLGSRDSPISPLFSRRSDTASSQNDTSLNNSTLLSDSTSASTLSESQSSKTIVLISSPASSKRSTCGSDSQRLSVSGRENQQDYSGEDLVSIHSSVSIISCPTSPNEDLLAGDGSETDISRVEEDKNLKRRSLSVTKTKQPPAPPRRTNSLHSNKIRNSSAVLVKCQETVLENDVSPTTADASRTTVTLSTPNSVMENGGTPTKSEASFMQRDKMERTISPSSGYSSQSGTPTLSPKEFSPTSPEKQKKSPVKPERSISRMSTSAGSPSSSLTSLSSGASEPVHNDLSFKDCTTSHALSSELSIEIKSLINIPPYPNVRAPCPPPPEVWAHNRHTVELLFGSYGNVQLSQPLEDTVKQARTLKQEAEENERPVEENMMKNEVELSESEKRDVDDPNKMALGKENLIIQDNVGEGMRTNEGLDQVGEGKRHDNLPVVTVTTTEEQLPTKPLEDEPKTIECCDAENNTDSEENGCPRTDTLTIELPQFPKDSPPATPPPTYHPTPPLSRKPPPSTLFLPSVELQKVQEESKVPESCWPPPPPPLEEAYEAEDETDFPLPPPPPLPVDNAVDTKRDKTDQNNPTNLTKHVLQRQKQESSSTSVSGEDITLQKGTQADILATVSTGSLLSTSSRQDSLKAEDPIHVAALQTVENQSSSVNFRRQPSASRAKEFHTRHKSVPIPKEDANIPLVTPSLLQMVRLRSVSMAEGEDDASSEEKSANGEGLLQESCPVAVQTAQNIPQKPIRKSLSVKSSSPQRSVTVVQPSLRLHEAIRMKTAAMSRKESLLARPVARLPPYNATGEPGGDTHKSTASTASFVFSRSNKKVIIDTVGPSPEAQITLTQNLAAELVHLSEKSKSIACSNGGIKSVPPPVARKPSYDSGGPLQTFPGNVGIQHQIAPLETKTTRVTPDTIETLF
ncbi:NHS-like protein 3 isoform X2 [Eucyclogobius newberryi]|uniref:NHS-like protein 3 isoform X2 n=1 Tax=Eucyclogobius newberryi TaxID=166745 RepID=UPI003B59C486